MSPNPTKAPWYFQGFQELLLHLHPVYAVFVWPLLGGLALVCLPLLKDSALPGGVWFGSRQGWRLAALGVAAGMRRVVPRSTAPAYVEAILPSYNFV